MGNEFVVKRNNAVYLRMLIVSLLGMIVSVLYYARLLVDSSLFMMILDSIIFVMFFFVFFVAIKKMFNRKPALSITSDGIIDDISLANAGEVPWKEIKSVKLEKYLNNEQILIALHNSEKIIEDLPYFKKKMVNQQFVDTGAVIVINPKMIKGKPQEIVSKIKKRAKV